jgi:lactoylglutathione lyase
MMFTQVDYIMLMVSDMQRSIHFYRDLLGIALKFETPEWTEFQTGATILALHGGASPNKSANQMEGQVAGSCSIGFNVSNIEETYEQLKSKGVRFVMPPTDREEEKIKLAVAIDPDGLPVSFAESKQR